MASQTSVNGTYPPSPLAAMLVLVLVVVVGALDLLLLFVNERRAAAKSIK